MYEALQIYDLEGEFVGWIVVKRLQGNLKIDGSNLYGLDEFGEVVERVNQQNRAIAIKANWPEQNDPEVIKLLQDPSFEPSEAKYSSSVIDEANSDLITYMDAENYEQIDWEASNVVYKNIQLDSPVSSVQRIHRAQETIARKRAGL